MTDPIAVAREGLATLIYKTKPFLTGRQAKEIADAILAAFPQITEPSRAAVETARDVARANFCDSAMQPQIDRIAAAITAAEARVREECSILAFVRDRNPDRRGSGDDHTRQIGRPLRPDQQGENP